MNSVNPKMRINGVILENLENIQEHNDNWILDFKVHSEETFSTLKEKLIGQHFRSKRIVAIHTTNKNKPTLIGIEVKTP